METANTAQPTPQLLTEDLGKIFEMAICLLYNIPFEGKYKYRMEDAIALKTRIQGLRDVFNFNIKHTAKNGNQYDFECVDDTNLKLSAKTTKKDGKVCPQVIGQPSKKKFCAYFEIPESYTMEEIKTYIENHTSAILDTYFHYTFDCPIVYYNQKKDILRFIICNKKIEWEARPFEFSHRTKNKIWNESTTISISGVTIGEFQVHNHRDCIKFRWCFEKLLATFSDCFDIIDMPPMPA